jgi:hypothetical protein
MSNNYDLTKALDMLLTNDTAASAQPSKKLKVAEVEKGNEQEIL